MPRLYFSLKRKRSLMLSLYALSSLTAIGYGLLMLGSLVHLLRNSSVGAVAKFFPILANNLALIGLAMVLSLPFALAITIVVVSRMNHTVSSFFRKALLWIDQAPILLFGLFFMVQMGERPFALILTYTVIAVVKISKRWIGLSKTVSGLQLDAASSLGMSRRQILVILYLRLLLKCYVFHFLAVVCLLFTLFTPFLVFYTSSVGPSHLISLELFRRLGQDPKQTASIVFLILIAHLMKVVFDLQAVPKRAENG